jgi:hypothetical protein
MPKVEITKTRRADVRYVVKHLSMRATTAITASSASETEFNPAEPRYSTSHLHRCKPDLHEPRRIEWINDQMLIKSKDKAHDRTDDLDESLAKSRENGSWLSTVLVGSSVPRRYIAASRLEVCSGLLDPSVGPR